MSDVSTPGTHVGPEDREMSGRDRDTYQDRDMTGQDRDTYQDRQRTGEDRDMTGQDRDMTGEGRDTYQDRQRTGEDRDMTGQDRDTYQDRQMTGHDRDTYQDRQMTGQDREMSGASREMGTAPGWNGEQAPSPAGYGTAQGSRGDGFGSDQYDADRSEPGRYGAGGTQEAAGPRAAGGAGQLISDASRFRSRWESVQVSFVDDPRQAVAEAESLVSDVLSDLTSGFRRHREQLESSWNQGEEASTEHLRQALQRYRKFFESLLSA